jgi:lipopolysaccharide transport system ATP-binding protein
MGGTLSYSPDPTPGLAAAARAQVVVRAEGLGKRYRIASRRRARAGTLREALSTWTRRRWRAPHGSESPEGGARLRDVWALRDVAFAVARGEALGIVGPNGSGKTTLLSVVTGITEPTTGWLATRGRVASLLAVGAGFHPDLTGRDNVRLNGIVLGMRAAEVRRRFDEIVAFAGVERFIDTPVKHYSDGMYMRLAFAVALHLEPDIVLVDEGLAVGDAVFREQVLATLETTRDAGRAILLVSHDLAIVRRLCTRVLRLEAGRAVDIGPAAEVLGRYAASGPADGRTG